VGDNRNNKINQQIEKDAQRLSKTATLLLYGLYDSGRSIIANKLKMGNDIHSQKHNVRDYMMKYIMGKAQSPERNEGMLGMEEVVLEEHILQGDDYESVLSDYEAQQYHPHNISETLQRVHKPTGIVETEYEYKDIIFRMIEVVGSGLQRKWIHCFEDVTAILFCVALDDFDVYDGDTNRMRAALDLFEGLCGNQCLFDTNIILVFTNKDRFEEKIEQVDITTAFPNYSGERIYKDMILYISNQFINKNTSPNRFIHPIVMQDTFTTKAAICEVVQSIACGKILYVAGLL